MKITWIFSTLTDNFLLKNKAKKILFIYLNFIYNRDIHNRFFFRKKEIYTKKYIHIIQVNK